LQGDIAGLLEMVTRVVPFKYAARGNRENARSESAPKVSAATLFAALSLAVFFRADLRGS